MHLGRIPNCLEVHGFFYFVFFSFEHFDYIEGESTAVFFIFFPDKLKSTPFFNDYIFSVFYQIVLRGREIKKKRYGLLFPISAGSFLSYCGIHVT